LVKVTEGNQELFSSHVTWGHYVNMLRVFKHYTLSFQHPSTKSRTVSLSSFPGFIASGDDYYLTDRGLIVTETTLGVYNNSLYNFVQPTNSVLYWVRIVLANRMSSSGPEWGKIFSMYNSGTYNNEWQIVDTKLFSPGQVPKPNTLFILEQLPGYIMSADATSVLIEQGYFPSYNIPYFPFIYNISGTNQAYNNHGNAYSYQYCPRANIFRRDQSKVKVMTDMENLMRYNNYQGDPFSLSDACNGISARCDLNQKGAKAFGGLDCKISDSTLIKTMTTNALSGPTTLKQPAFQWSNWASTPHYGQPSTFNFPFIEMQPHK